MKTFKKFISEASKLSGISGKKLKESIDIGEIGEKVPTLDDGIYDITGLAILWVSYDDGDSKQGVIDAFIAKHPGAVVAIPYSGGGEDSDAILLSKTPKSIKDTEGHVGRGAALIINNAPSRILIVAEND